MRKKRLVALSLALAARAPEALAWRTGPFIVFFDYDSERLTAHAAGTLDVLVQELRTFPEAHVVIRGHTDLTGAAAGNLALSCRRARAAEAYLLARGVAPDRMAVQGWGEEDPDVPTEDNVREPQNRRAAFTFGTAVEIATARSDPHRC